MLNTDDVFGKWTVVQTRADKTGPFYKALCECACGVRQLVLECNLRHGQSTQCKRCAGLGKTRGFKHGHSTTVFRSRTYISWDNMIQRCTNPNRTGYENYGGRGISVCDRWKLFKNFLVDMGERPAGLTIERVDNNRGYNSQNCKWADSFEQMNNRRVSCAY